MWAPRPAGTGVHDIMANHRPGKIVDHGRLIARHLETRLCTQSKELVDRALEMTGLQWMGSVVRLRKGGAVTAETSRRYKEAVGVVFGPAARGMAQVNFMLAGCQCEDCKRASLETE